MNTENLSAVVLGDYSTPMYHPFKGIDNILIGLLSEKMKIKCTGDRDILKSENLKDYNLCIMYADSWEGKLKPEQLGGLISFTASGGGLLVIHCGISYQTMSEYAQMIGAKFKGHPPYQKIQFKVKDSNHPITLGVEDFEMEEELYTFEFDNFSQLDVLVECSNSDLHMPAVWARSYGLGRIVYLAPGHDPHSFLNPDFRKLIINSALWVSK